MTRHRYSTTVEHGAFELDVTYSFEVAWGSPETGRFGPPEDYDPGCGDAVECVKIVEVEGRAWPCSFGEYGADELGKALLVHAATSGCEAEMLAAAVEDKAAEAEAAAEYRADTAREDHEMERRA